MNRRIGSKYTVVILAAVLMAVAWSSVAQVAEPVAPRVEIGFGTTLDPETRTLVEPGTAFPADTERVWCLTRVIGLEAPATVTHVWYHGGQTRARVELTVGSANWRTWSAKRMLPGWTGTWEVKVLDADGTVLGSASFDVN